MSVQTKRTQTERGISVNQNDIRPKLTSAQRKTMTADEKKEYSAQRLKEYRKAYSELYISKITGKDKSAEKKEREIAYRFYKEYKARQELLQL